jgi:hypothetical protein
MKPMIPVYPASQFSPCEYLAPMRPTAIPSCPTEVTPTIGRMLASEAISVIARRVPATIALRLR